MNTNNIVYIKIDNWYDGDLPYLQQLENNEHLDEINYSEVWYDMAIVYCITTTKEYAKKHGLIKHQYRFGIDLPFDNYFPKYNPNKFGCEYRGEYEDWAPYKDFNKELENALRKKLIKS